MDYGAIFEEVCEQLGDEPVYTGNHPADFTTLSPEQQHILVYWIQHVLQRADRYHDRTSYGLKHDFEKEGFYVTNGQFKGAMLVCGYIPKAMRELNWIFRIKPPAILHFDREYARMLLEAGYL